MATKRYVKYNGLSQENLVGILKDIEAALGTTNVEGSITIPASTNVGKTYFDAQDTTHDITEVSKAWTASISAKVAAGSSAASTFHSAISEAVSSGYNGGLMRLLYWVTKLY